GSFKAPARLHARRVAGQMVQRHGRAAARESLDRGEPDARSAAGNKRGFAGKIGGDHVMSQRLILTSSSTSLRQFEPDSANACAAGLGAVRPSTARFARAQDQDIFLMPSPASPRPDE